jgi:hypothetical protein
MARHGRLYRLGQRHRKLPFENIPSSNASFEAT